MNMNQKTKKITVLVQFLISVTLLTGLDQWTKYLAVRHLKDQADIPLIPNVLYLHYLENRGAAFGIFQGQKTWALPLAFSRTSLFSLAL